MKRSKGSQRQIVKKISERILQAMTEEDIEGEVRGREKHLYSIYKKMAEKKRLLSDVVDVYGFRIIVDDVNTCYRLLGIVHGLYKPMPGRFKDYIAIPRINGYQSLHTTLFGPKGLPLEVQIRTRDMDSVAESGVAAHWRYKAIDKSSATPQRRARDWLARLEEIQQSRNIRGISRKRQSGFVSGQNLCVHAEGRHPAVTQRCHCGRFRLCGAYRRWQPLRRRQSRPNAGAIAHHAA